MSQSQDNKFTDEPPEWLTDEFHRSIHTQTRNMFADGTVRSCLTELVFDESGMPHHLNPIEVHYKDGRVERVGDFSAET